MSVSELSGVGETICGEALRRREDNGGERSNC